jgi:two-component system, OmpR family, response regulator RegX3
MPNARQTICIVSPDVAVTRRMQCVFREHGYESAVSSNIADVRQHPPALVLIDTNRIPHTRVKDIRNLGSMPIVSFREPEIRCSEEECVDELDDGADGAIYNATYRVIVARVRAILRRENQQMARSKIYIAGPLRMDLERHEVTVDDVLVNLTLKEFALLHVLLESLGRVFSRQELLNRVWGEDYALDEHALDVHIFNLRRKLHSPTCSSLIMTVRGFGYKLEWPQRLSGADRK